MCRQRLYVHGFKEARPRQLRQPAGIVAVSLVRRQCLEGLVGLPALDADDGHAKLDEAVVEHRRPAAHLEHHPRARWCGSQGRRDGIRRRRCVCLVNHPPVAIKNANVDHLLRSIDRFVDLSDLREQLRHYYREIGGHFRSGR